MCPFIHIMTLMPMYSYLKFDLKIFMVIENLFNSHNIIEDKSIEMPQ